MSSVALRQMVGAPFDLFWSGRTRVAWPNAEFEPEPTEEFIKFSMSAAADTEQLEFGANNCTVRETGRMFVQVFVPTGTGDMRARELADTVAEFVKAHPQLTSAAGRLILRRATIKDIGAAGAHYQINVATPYLYDTY